MHELVLAVSKKSVHPGQMFSIHANLAAAGQGN